MTSHRTISLTLTLLAVLATAAPSSAFAGPLLSGYGGPGEGNQAILGSTLIGGAGGGSGSSGGSSGSDGSSVSAVAGAQLGHGNGALSSSHGSGSKTPGVGPRTSGRGVGRGSGGKEASAGAAHTYQVSSGSGSSQVAPGGLDALGLSAADLLYVLLALGALGATGVLTRRLARTSTRAEGL